MPYKEKVPDTLPWLLVLALQLNDLGVNIVLLSADQAAGSLPVFRQLAELLVLDERPH
jgi:hypothetical protein